MYTYPSKFTLGDLYINKNITEVPCLYYVIKVKPIDRAALPFCLSLNVWIWTYPKVHAKGGQEENVILLVSIQPTSCP